MNNSIKIYETHYNDPIMIAPKEGQAEYFVTRTKLHPPKNIRVFEPGCGIGVLGSYIKNKFKVDVYGMELSKTAIKMAKSKGIMVKKET